MDPASLPGLLEAISPARFAPYLAACARSTDEAIRLYTWNVEVAAAFWGPLHALEVTLRNAMNDQMAYRYQRSDWWSDRAVVLHEVMASQLRDAERAGAKVAKKNRRARVPDDVVAALSFGFWTGLLGSGKRLQYETKYWQPFLHQAFPHYNGSRADLHRSLDAVRLFRNRVAHHEPIFGRHLVADHSKILTVAGWISSDAAKYVGSHSRVPDTLSRRAMCVSQGLRTSF